jgi:WD domain, G-beta repeat
MTGPDQDNEPRGDSWAVTVHSGSRGRHGREPDDRTLGSGVLIDRSRVLTSLSVVGPPAGGNPDAAALWVTFPLAGGTVRHPVRQISADGGLAVLELVSPAPREARPAPLRRTPGDDLIGERWRASGADAYGVIAAPLPGGRVRLATESPADVPAGAAGAGVWSVRLAAVVGVIDGDSQAHTLERVGRAPQDAGDVAGRPVRVASDAGPAGRSWSLEVGAEPGRLWRPGTDGGLVESDPWQPTRRPPGKAGPRRRKQVRSRATAGAEQAPYRTAWIAGARRPERIPSAGGAVRLLCPVTFGEQVLVASAAADGSVALADPATGQAWHTLRSEPGQVRALVPLRLPDATCLGIVSADGSLTAWAAEQGWGQTFTAHSGRATTATCAEAGLLAVGGEDGTVELRAVGETRPRWAATAGSGPVSALCTLPGLLATAGADGLIRLRDTESGALRRTLESAGDPVAALCPAPIGDRTLLAAAGDDGAVRLWDPYTGELRQVLAGHTGPVTALCPLPDGRIASVGTDRTARLWDPVTGAAEPAIELHYEAVACVAAGEHLIVGLAAGTVAYSLED